MLSIGYTAAAFGLYYLGRRERSELCGREERESSYYALLGAGLVIIVQILAAAFFGSFRKSPYSHTLSGIVCNLWGVIPAVFFRESFRCLLLLKGKHYIGGKRHGRWQWNRVLTGLGAIILFTALQLNYMKILTLHSTQEVMTYLFEFLLPLVIRQALLNELMLQGKMRATVLYELVRILFEWLFPILPALNWFITAIVDNCVPCILLCVLSERRTRLTADWHRVKKDMGKGIWITMIGCVAFIWFFAGVFPVYPSVVLTGSMEPVIYPGDLVLIEKFTSKEEVLKLKEGEILNFQRDHINISHRILNVITDDAGNVYFETKGDNNSTKDVQLVEMKDVKGIIRYTIPKIGMPVLWLKGSDRDVEKEVTF